MHHGHVDIKVMGLLEALPTLVAGKLQLRLSFVFGHVVLERCSLSALETTDFAPARQSRGLEPSLKPQLWRLLFVTKNKPTKRRLQPQSCLLIASPTTTLVTQQILLLRPAAHGWWLSIQLLNTEGQQE